jgi:hypothetical protein
MRERLFGIGITHTLPNSDQPELTVHGAPDDKDRVIAALRKELEAAQAWIRRAREELVEWQETCGECDGLGEEPDSGSECRNCGATLRLLREKP